MDVNKKNIFTKENMDSFALSNLYNYKSIDKEFIEDIKNNKLVIYTAFTGNSADLNKPDHIDDFCEYICFTNNPDLKSDFWKIIYVDSKLDDDKFIKKFKILAHLFLEDFKYSFWIDSNYKIIGSIREYIYNHASSPILCLLNPETDCPYEDAQNSADSKIFSSFSIRNQTNTYKLNGLPEHYGSPSLVAIFRENHNPKINNLMTFWWDQLMNFSNQDKFSFVYSCWVNNVHPSVSKIFPYDNQYWTKVQDEKERTDYLTSKNLIKSLEGNIEESNELSKEEILLLINDIESLKYDVDILNHKKHFTELDLIALQNSNSWKMTEPLRNRGKSKKSDE